MEFTKDIHFSNGLKENEVVGITYSGELYQNQSEFVAIVYGFGENWEHTSEKEMIKTENGFTADIEIKPNFDTFNFCFRNGNYEWDNNQTFNYISAIQPATLEQDIPQVQDFIEEILEGLLEENLTYTTDPAEIVSNEIENKQQILEDILSETTPIQDEPAFIEEFDMNQLLDSILNPVIHSETIENDLENIMNFETKETDSLEEDWFEDILTDTSIQELKEELENSIMKFTNEQNEVSEPVVAEVKEEKVQENTTTALVPTPEDTYLVSPRKLRKFYMFVKKVKLAFYKLFVAIPKILSSTFDEEKN